MSKRTPLYERHSAAGGRFVPFAGYDMPVQYAGVNAEHALVRSAVGLFDVSHMGEVRVRGVAAAEVIDRLVSNEMSSMVPGQARYTLLCNEQGGVVDDLVVYRMAADDFLICVNAANRDKDFAWMVEHNPRKGEVELTDEGDDWVQIAVQGRLAVATLAPLTMFDVEGLAYYHHARVTVAGVEGCIVARTGYTGEDGFEVFVPAAHGVEVWDELMHAGAPFGVAPIGLGARDTLRLEARMPLYGHELSDELSPRQARLMRFVKPDKAGGFIGAEAMAERADGDTHFLAGLVVEGKRIPREGMTVRSESGEEIGWVTSGTRSPSLKRGIALAYLRRGFGKPDTRVVVDVRGRDAAATVVRGSFYKRDY